jgi:hypothetical protein
MPINGESANMQGTAMGYLLARNMMYEMYSYTTETRRLLNKSASRMEQVPFPKASVSEHVRKLALQAYKNLQK